MTYLIAMPGGIELAVIVFALLLLFGGKGIPRMMKGLGQGIKEFRSAKKEIQGALEEGVNDIEQIKETVSKPLERVR